MEKKELIGRRVDLKQYFHPHYLWQRDADAFSPIITLGHYDTIKAVDVHTLIDLAPEEINLAFPGEPAPYTTTTVSLVLNSFLNKFRNVKSTKDPQSPEGIAQHEKDVKVFHKKRKFWIFIEIYLSAVTIDVLKRRKLDAISVAGVQFKSLGRGVELVGSKLQEMLDSIDDEGVDSILYRSIGAQDFVIELKFDEEDNFRRLAELVIGLRQLEFSDIFPKDHKPNHHVFSQVNAITSFDEGEVDKGDNPKKESLVKIRQKIRIAPGHEFEVFNQALHSDRKIKYESYSLGFENKNLHVNFEGGFVDYIHSRRKTLTQHHQNTGSVRSELTVPLIEFARENDELQTQHAAIVMRDNVKRIIDECILKLKSFWTRKILSKSQFDELSNLVQSAVQGLSRNDKQIYLIDLIPFLQGIPAYIEAMFKEGIATIKEKERFLKSLDNAIDLLTRAVRNRIDELSSFRDPMAPSNRTLVAPKLMSAYSTCASYAWALMKDSAMHTYPIRACAFVGSSGKVIVHRPLVESHNYLHSKGYSNLPKLLFYELSGPMLFRPEIVFVNTIHEIAEESKWLDFVSSPFGPYLKDLILRNVLSQINSAFVSTTIGDLTDDERKLIIDTFCNWVASQPPDVFATDGRTLAAFHQFPFLLRGKDLDEFFKSNQYTDRCSNIRRARLHEERLLKSFIEFSAFDHHESDQTDEGLKARSFVERIHSQIGLIEECFADFAMLLYLFRSRVQTDSKDASTGEYPSRLTLQDAEYLCSSLLETLFSATPGLFVATDDTHRTLSLENLSEYFYRSILIIYLCLKFDRKHEESNKTVVQALVSNTLKRIVRFEVGSLDQISRIDESVLDSFITNRFDDLKKLLILPSSSADGDESKCIANYFIKTLEAAESPETFSSWLTLPSDEYEKELGSQFIELWSMAVSAHSKSDALTNFKRLSFLDALWCESTFHDIDGIFQELT
jgi:hypothetical protein